ncbi:hypothetical protein KSF_096100 [Reticulibacter mediterranei]|uniref:Methyl-accepting chemotaxis protein n=2 Tax=Reticulibacter mediterranei TaxID=2778369 RepID=A0A8J3N5R6_9CHLR|nr:hypothetical protein KSF_096100 [Reticulibacter mediterranei]
MSSLARASLILVIVLKLIFLGILYVEANFSPTNLVDQIDLQRIRSQLIAKDARILQMNPSEEKQAQAISEMQNALPGWQATQTGLRQGDRSLGLPHSVPDNVQLSLIQAQPDYIAMLNAVKAILANHSGPIDQVQVTTILNHERGYFLAMSQVEMLWQQQLDTWRQQFFIAACVVMVLIMIIIALTHFFITMRAIQADVNGSTTARIPNKE